MSNKPVPDGHEWWGKKRYDRMVFWCDGCDVELALSAADTQAGIRIYCPECHDEMAFEVPDE